MLTPITYDEAVIEVGRFLQHYPQRAITKDAVVIQDLAVEFEVKKFGLGVVVAGLRYLRNRHDKDNPARTTWVPQTGEIMQELVERQESLENQLTRLTTPNRKLIERKTVEDTPPKMWEDLTEDERKETIEFTNRLQPGIRRSYLKSFNAPEDVINGIDTAA